MTIDGWYHFVVWLWHQVLYGIAWLTIYRWARAKWKAHR